MTASSSTVTLEVISAKGLFKQKHSYIKSLRVHVVFGSTTRSSEDVTDTLNEDTIFDFSTDFDIDCTLREMKDRNQPIYVYISESIGASIDEPNTSIDFQPVGHVFSRTLIAQAVIDSRLAYIHNDEYLSVELVACNAGGVIDTGFSGVLFVRLTAQGTLSSLCQALEEVDITEINANIERNQRHQEKMNYEQYQSLKAWFANCRAAYPYLEDRKIKLISLDECGRHRMVCNFVGSITPSRELDSPRFAARFVSLIPFHRSIELIGGNLTSWKSPFATLLNLQGDVEDHAILLCSLLLGWGMDAYVAYGTLYRPTASGQPDSTSDSLQHYHYWVVTLDELAVDRVAGESTGQNPADSRCVVCWEPLTGQQFRIPVKSANHFFTVFSGLPLADTESIRDRKHPFRFIYSLFRNDAMFVNIQQHPNISYDADAGTPMASFDISNTKFWSKLANPAFDTLKHPGAAVTVPLGKLRTSSRSVDLLALEDKLESAVMQAITSARNQLGFQTYFDQQLSQALQPALIAYELDRAVGCSFGNDDFQTSIKRSVRKGETFKAYPTCFPFVHIPSILSALMRTAAFQDVIRSSSKQGFTYPGGMGTSNSVQPTTRHALRIRIAEYPEQVCAVWILVAVCFAP